LHDKRQRHNIFYVQDRKLNSL